MHLARVIGQVVASKKDPAMTGRKLLILRPLLVDESSADRLVPGKNTLVAVDALGCGEGETVLFCQGSSARQAETMKPLPIDAAIIGIVDTITVDGKNIAHGDQ